MSHVSLSKEEADTIYQFKKRIEENTISWEEHEGNSKEITISLIAEDGTPLKIRGWYSWQGSNRYGFSLLYRNNIVIRRWDDKKGHPDPITKRKTNGPHKHYHHPEYGDSCCYETDDVRIGNVNGALIDFLKECNVSLEGVKFQEVM